jgi:hypothetical protein
MAWLTEHAPLTARSEFEDTIILDIREIDVSRRVDGRAFGESDARRDVERVCGGHGQYPACIPQTDERT